MFSPILPLDPKTGRARSAAVINPQRPNRFRAPQTIDEAYEMRLLAEVARWDDQPAFEEIYARHHAAVTRVALQVCRDAATAEDIAQQTFTALWVRADRLVDKSVRLRPWLTTVARNAAIDHVRSDRPTASLAEAAQLASNAPSPQEAAFAALSSAELSASLATLSADQRAAVEYVYLAGMTYAATAAALGEPIGTIKSRVRLALGHLRRRAAAHSCCDAE